MDALSQSSKLESKEASESFLAQTMLLPLSSENESCETKLEESSTSRPASLSPMERYLASEIDEEVAKSEYLDKLRRLEMDYARDLDDRRKAYDAAKNDLTTEYNKTLIKSLGSPKPLSIARFVFSKEDPISDIETVVEMVFESEEEIVINVNSSIVIQKAIDERNPVHFTIEYEPGDGTAHSRFVFGQISRLEELQDAIAILTKRILSSIEKGD